MLFRSNLLFILDDSGSMGWNYLPDAAGSFGTDRYGRTSSQCNGVAYNPTVTYSPPLNAQGNSVGDASLSSITPNPLTQTGSQRNLSGTVNMPTAPSATTITVTVSASNMRSNWYGVDSTVTLFQNNDSTRFFTASVVSWNRSEEHTSELQSH